MILDAIVQILTSVLSGVFSLFPDYVFPGSVEHLGGSVGAWAGAANGFFPVETLGLCIGLVLGVRLFVALYRVVVFIYDLIPLKFT